MKKPNSSSEDLTRRKFMANAAKTFFGVSIGGSLSNLYAENISPSDQVINAPASFGKAKSVIYLFMSGGMSHLDTFDPKPDAGEAIMGKTETINGKGDIRLGHHLKKIATESDSISLIRSMSSTQGAHSQGRYFMRTGFTERATITHPTAGAWVNNLKATRNQNVPSYVTVNCGNQHPGAGFLPPSFNPLPVGDAEKGLSDVKRPSSISDEEFDCQMKLQKQLDVEFDAQYKVGYKNVRAYNEMYESAVKLMESEDLAAFDLSKESEITHELYGEHKFAKGCLLARRLVERNVNFIEVEFNGFDWHNDNFENADNMLPVLDNAVSALLADLKIKGLLDTTLVVLTTEFGRNPKINKNYGRDHYPKAFSCMLAGAGIKGGNIYGQTSENGSTITENKVTATDLNATIAHSVGIPFNMPIFSPSKRPFKMGGKDGKPIYNLFS